MPSVLYSTGCIPFTGQCLAYDREWRKKVFRVSTSAKMGMALYLTFVKGGLQG